MHSLTFVLLLVVTAWSALVAQPTNRPYVYVDIAHGQRFWNDPNDPVKGAGQDIERLKYMTRELEESASAANATLRYLKTDITPNALANNSLLFVHIPSAQYSAEEVAAVQQYIRQGGSLFLVLDSDYWSTLEQTNVNDLIKPFGIQMGANSQDTRPGGYAVASAVTPQKTNVIYHGARTLAGGTPFCFNDQSDECFGVYQDVEGGGRIVVMGDGMVSLYMTDWEGVEGYPSQEFMQNVFQWLLE